MEELDQTAYLAARGYEELLLSELRGVTAVHGRLVLAGGPPQPAHWAQETWFSPACISIRSVKDGVRQLRAIQRNWALYSFRLHRRARLIQDQLPHVSARPLSFPEPPPASPLGGWTLLDERTIIASPRTSSAFPLGEPQFVEWKEGPPNRAYLKLWEALTVLGSRPGPGELCLEGGASPGGWTWALARLGARVVAVDRAPLHPSVAALPGVEYRKGSVFSVLPPREGLRREGLPPRDGPFDWILSDVVCYPERLWSWVKHWLDSGLCRRFVCTVKFQGDSHYGAIRDFASVPGSRLVHLSRNRHELTWMLDLTGG